MIVGRAGDLAALAARFDGSRLVTVLGPAGVGKTHLAKAFVSEDPDAVWCDLLAATSTFDVLYSVSAALDVPLAESASEEEALATLGEHLAAQPRTIVLDNFEQLVDTSAAVVPALAAHAPILITSQVRLGVDGEAVLDLAPLSTDDAAALFVERARAIRDDYAPSDEENGAIERICRALDGLPLAIELAAARVRVLTAVELERRIDERFAVLASADRGRPKRHATLRAALDWSFSLLDDDERETLAQCTVFAGGFDVEAAESVIQTDGNVLDRLHALRDKSLLLARHDAAGTRFDLYLSVRDYAAEHLADDHEVHRRHTAYYLSHGLLWAARSEGRDSDATRLRLDVEQRNIVAVFRRAIADGRADDALTATLALQPMLIMRGPAALRREILDEALTLAEAGADRRLVGWARLARGDTAYGLGRMKDAESLIQQAIEDGDAVGDRRLYGRALWRQGTNHLTRDDHERAEAVLLEALDVHREVDDEVHAARCRASLGTVALERGDLELARERFEDAYDELEAAGDERWLGHAIASLGAIADAHGDLDEAKRRYAKAIEIHERLSDQRHLARVLAALGSLDIELGGGRERLLRAADIVRHVPNPRIEATIEMWLGWADERDGDTDAAAARYRAAERRLRTLEGDRWRSVIELRRSALDGRPRETNRSTPELEALSTITDGRRLVATDPGAAKQRLESVAEAAKRSTLVRRAAQDLRAALSDGLRDDALVIGDGWFKAPHGTKVDIAHRRAPAALLAAFARERSRPLTVDDLFEAGWPGEKALPDAIRSRVYVAISTLRKAGMGDLIVKDEEGYRLAPDIPVLVI